MAEWRKSRGGIASPEDRIGDARAAASVTPRRPATDTSRWPASMNRLQIPIATCAGHQPSSATGSSPHMLGGRGRARAIASAAPVVAFIVLVVRRRPRTVRPRILVAAYGVARGKPRGGNRRGTGRVSSGRLRGAGQDDGERGCAQEAQEFAICDHGSLQSFAVLGGGISRLPACRGRKDTKIAEMICVSPEKRRKAGGNGLHGGLSSVGPPERAPSYRGSALFSRIAPGRP